MRLSRLFLMFVGSTVLWTGCASLRSPDVRVASMRLDGVSLTGARVDVGLQIRNVNPEDLQIERFDYEVKINGKILGRGFQSTPLMLAGFEGERVVSRLDINLLKIPGAVRRSLDRDRVDAEVKGTFYVRDGARLRKLRFGSHGTVDLNGIGSRPGRE